jgi:hypothetical protein
MPNYIVERREPQSNRWQYVPEWGDYGSRLFCRPSCEVTATHLVRRRLWPGQKIRVGGFRVGDDGRFTIFLEAHGNGLNTPSTVAFRVDHRN